MSVDDKENVNYLEEVERNILLRRRQNRDPLITSAGKENSQEPTRLLRSARSSSRLKGSFSRTMTAKKLTANMSMTPEDMYRTTGASDQKAIPDDKLMEKMQQEIVFSRKEIRELRDRLKKMEEGQMTVDNLQLSKRLDDEKNGLNTERGLLLREHSKQTQDFETLRKKFLEEKSKAEEEFIKRKALLEKMAKDLELEKTQYKATSEDLSRRATLAEVRDSKLLEQEAEMKKQLEELSKQKTELAEYQIELSDLKDRLLSERDRILREKQAMEGEKTDLERDIKGLKALKESLEKEREKELKEINKRRNELNLVEDKLNRENDRLGLEEERLKRDRSRADEEIKKYRALSEELEEERLKMWKDRNNLNQEVRQFIDDRKKMESDMMWRNKELDQADDDIQKDLEDLDKERQDLLELESKLEEFKHNLETRERKLIDEKEDFNAMKLRFIENLMDSGGLSHLTPEMKAMAKNMGLDVDEMVKERDQIDNRKRELDRLKRMNDEELMSLKQKAAVGTNALSSRRSSIVSQRRASIAQALKNKQSNPLTHKMTSESFLADMYDNASNQYIVKTMKENRERIDSLTEEKLFAQKLIDQLRTENKQLVRDFDILTKIIEQYRSEGLKIDINTVLGRFKTQETGTWTAGDFEEPGSSLGYDEDKASLERRVRELESKLRRGSIGYGADEGDYDARLKEIQEQLRRMMIQIEVEQTEYAKQGFPEVANRLKTIHFLVYSFIQDIIQFQLRFNRPRDSADRDMFNQILNSVNFTAPAAASEGQTTINLKTVMGTSGVEVASDLQDLVRRLQIRMQEVEHHNSNLRAIIEGMKATFDFFEFANDQYIMNRT